MPQSRSPREMICRKKNRLSKKYGELETDDIGWESFILNDGFSRETISPQRRIWQAKYFSQWPMRLTPAEDFEWKHTVQSRYRPKRGMVGATSGGLNYKKIQVKAGGESEISSSCSIATNSYTVKREY